MRPPRVQPPRPRLIDGEITCPLDGSTLRRHDWSESHGAWVSCAACQAYWSPADVADGREGHWDDSGLVCVASTVRLDASGSPVWLDCVLGDDHADDVGASAAVHVSTDLVCWSADEVPANAYVGRPTCVRGPGPRRLAS